MENLKTDYDWREFARSLGLGHREGYLQEDLYPLFAIERDYVLVQW